jgi:triphosphoribosyl-dephospho-CoA synthase
VLEYWGIGVLEYWSTGTLDVLGASDMNTVRAKMNSNNYASTSDHSITPLPMRRCTNLCPPHLDLTPASIARSAANALTEELATYPKPGLVSFVDQGSHPDMDAECFLASIGAIKDYFGEMAAAGAGGRKLLDLQRIGISAEESMLDATGGKNTHRGAIYCLGLLAAAAGKQMADGNLFGLSLGRIVAESWGDEILLPDALLQTSRGLEVCHRYKLGGVRGEAKQGFPSIFKAGLPAFQTALISVGREAARVQAFFAILEVCEDTTLFKRGGDLGWKYAQKQVRRFWHRGGVVSPDWKILAEEIHAGFVARHLTAGGAADLLAATLFISHLNLRS